MAQRFFLNVARTVTAESVFGEHVSLVPVQEPLQRTNFQPFAGAARNVNAVPAENRFEQAGEHLTAPFPVIETVTGIVAGPKTAVTEVACARLS